MQATLVTTAKNEGPYILEWVAHHKRIGFDNIVFFQNDSDDYTHQTLVALRKLGEVEYYYNRAESGQHQVKAYKRASKTEAFRNSNWSMALDLDEFLTVHVGDGTVKDLVEACPDCDQITINWKLFGNSGHRFLRDDLVTERFSKAEPCDLVAEHLVGFKSLFRNEAFGRPGIHNPRDAKKPESAIRKRNGSGLPEDKYVVKNWRCTDPGKRSLAQVNHYAVKDTASYVLKNARGSAHQANRNLDTRYWRLNNFNSEDDLSLVRKSGLLRDHMNRLNHRSNDRLYAMREKAIRTHRERFDVLIQKPENAKLFETCNTISK